MAKQIPVYLFTGFLESGKTTFAQETLEDETFNNGDRMLLLVCEEGIEEYEPDTFAASNIYKEVIESEAELTSANLAALLKKHRSLLRFCSRTAAQTEQRVIALLSDALQIHDDLESYYIRALNPAFLDRTAATMIQRIAS